MDPFVITLVVVAVIVVLGVAVFVWRGKKTAPPPRVTAEKPAEVLAPVPVQKKEKGLEEKLRKTRGSLAEKLGKFFQGSGSPEDKEWEAIEEALLEGDVGIQTTTVLLSRVKEK